MRELSVAEQRYQAVMGTQNESTRLACDEIGRARNDEPIHDAHPELGHTVECHATNRRWLGQSATRLST